MIIIFINYVIIFIKINIENSNNETNNNNNNNIELNIKEKQASHDISEKIINNLLIGYDESYDNSDILK